MNNVDEIVSALTADGWKESNNKITNPFARLFYKRFATKTACSDNRDKDGIQVCCEVYPGTGGIEISLEGGLKDSSWIRLSLWAITPNDLQTVLSKIPNLLKTGEFTANL